MTIDIDTALASRAWPFEEAKKIIDRHGGKCPEKGYVLFETGYGPSGLPHIGTFGEVARTTMVRRALEAMTGWKTRLLCVSDDMDGMRKIPDNLPNPEKLEPFMQKPLTQVPDPFGCHEGYGQHMNAKLCGFLDHFGFEYEFASASELYKNGTYDAALLVCAKHYDAIMGVMLPTLGEERRQTYSPFLPISPKSGRVLYVPMKAVDAAAGTITFDDEDGTEVTIPVTGGNVKLQWKPDFGMRWAALDVDFEMYGKDHLANGKVYSAICEILGGKAPEQFCYEMFLDDKGQKISKSKGNGITIDEWLRYAPQDSLALYMFQSPRKAKRLYFDVIPRAVDEYITFLTKFQSEDEAKRLANPVWHIHNGNPPSPESLGVGSLSFGLLLNLASVCNPQDASVLWGFIGNYMDGATPEKYPYLDSLATHAVAYYHDFVKPTKTYRAPNELERKGLEQLAAYLKTIPADTSADDIQTQVFAIGTELGFEPLRDWFKALYETLLGQSQGPRMGSFFALYGVEESARLIERVLKGEDLAAA
jgi:lysyl-tRNA synthetase, class I